MIAQPAAEPAIAQDRADCVAALPQQAGHVVGLGAQAVVVAGPAGRHDVIADDRAVELGFVDAQRSDVQAGLRDARPHGELAAQQGAGLRLAGVLIPIGCDEGGAPVVRLEQARLHRDQRAPVRG